ncbi:MAG: pantetheine-phosphate adenylyltransferase [Clostridia bacterium]|nr:pantetheine-phosphate adenylyltransferase [Clostridia bacterium]
MKAICCGSFDPVTKGHEDLIRRASRLFEEVVVLIARNPDKTGFFPEETRRRFCEKTFADLKNVSVDVWDGPVVDYARRVGASVLVKGVRGSADLEYEQNLAEINRLLAPEIETVLLPTRPQFAAISSTYARAFLTGGKDPSALLPEAILNDIGN